MASSPCPSHRHNTVQWTILKVYLRLVILKLQQYVYYRAYRCMSFIHEFVRSAAVGAVHQYSCRLITSNPEIEKSQLGESEKGSASFEDFFWQLAELNCSRLLPVRLCSNASVNTWLVEVLLPRFGPKQDVLRMIYCNTTSIAYTVFVNDELIAGFARIWLSMRFVTSHWICT